MISTIDHSDFGIAVSQRLCCGYPGEPATNNHDPWPSVPAFA